MATPMKAGNGVLTLVGFGIRVGVERGQSTVSDGIGAERRVGRFARATCGLKRLVVVGHTGYITFEGIRWLSDVGAGFVQIDADGSVIGAWGPPGLDDARLRRAQACAGGTSLGLSIARDLTRAKLEGQRDVLGKLADTAQAAYEIDRRLAGLDSTDSLAQLRQLVGSAAAAYWTAWADVPVRFPTRVVSRLPDHWKRFGARTSPVTTTPRKAANPANALLSTPNKTVA